MDHLRKLSPSPALRVALAALVLAMSGAAIALPGNNKVGSSDIKNGAVRSSDIKSRTVKGADVQNDALKGKQILEDKLEAVPEAETVQTVTPFGDQYERASAADGADEASAEAAAEKLPLAAKGQLSIYAKCFRDAATDTVIGRIYIETSAAGAVFESSDGDIKEGGLSAADFLNPDTPETEREIASQEVTGVGAEFEHNNNDAWRAMAPDGTGLNGLFSIAVKNGELPEGNGVYGEGNVCLFGGDSIG
jgi:hypothetical protein